MNCVAKRVPATGVAGFFPPPAPFDIHHQHQNQHQHHQTAQAGPQATTNQAYLYSIHPLAAAAAAAAAAAQANDRADLSEDEPFTKQEPQWKRSERDSDHNNNNSIELPASHENCDQLRSPAVSKELEGGRSAEVKLMNSCDKSAGVECSQAEQQQQQQRRRRRRGISLESTGSRRESSASTNAEDRAHPQASAGAPATEPAARPASVSPTARSSALASGRSSRSVLVSTRFVSPPKIDDDQLISVINWQTVPLNDEKDNEHLNQHKRKQDASHETSFAQVRRPPGRLNSLITSCKMLSSRSSQDAGGVGKQRHADEQHPASNEKEPRKMSRAEQWTGEGQRRDTLADGAGRKRPSGEFARERIGSATSFKSTGSFHRSKPQIGKVKAPFMFAGILGSMLGSLFFSLGMLCIKLLPDGHGLADKTKIVFCRGCIMTLLCGATILYQKSTFKIHRDELWINVLRAVLGFIGVYGAYVALKYISLGDSTALVFSSPIWTSLLSHFILNEPLRWIQLMALPASLVGIIFIAHPALLVNMEQHAGAIERQPLLDVVDVIDVADLLPLNNATANLVAQVNQTLNHDLDISMSANEHFDFEHRWRGIVISLATSFIVSFVYIVLKFRKSTPIQTTTFWLGVATALFSLFVMCFTGCGEMPRGFYNWSLLICNGVCSWLGQVLLQWALAYEDASVLSVIRTLDVALNFTLSALFLDEQIMWTSVVGASIIALVVVSIMLNSWISKKLCPTEAEREANQQQQLDIDHDELSTSESRFSPASRDDNRQQLEKAPVEGEITFKLEAPSLRKLRQGELAA